jgi:hypothetical protein
MGKLSPKDFEEMSARLRARAIGIMKQLDRGGYREVIERDLGVRLGRRRSTPAKARTRNQRTEIRAAEDKLALNVVCECGVENDEDAQFCKACGSKLEAA